ncbi:MAG: FMN-binding protein [Cycloclasticus sp.]|nr:FMN-binding protein [Cycloclasticus sp.]MBG95339.1 FMN-binding protein [Cycloclasticus sp.]HAI97892.1 FMN-binding protein [Methylococcaceae bacterium]|tara:strand:+ start:40 stop:540 length:501 start_codon:yes stop_codon:yes gene_type:complete
MKRILLIIAVFFFQAASAKGVYQTPEAFLNHAFNGNIPPLSSVWLTKEKKQAITDILQHNPSFIRVKYWQNGSKTAWILDEIGKEKPITVGVIVETGKIQQLKVLSFRESRGWEVKHAFFTRQFDNIGINDKQQLDKPIDGISGATLSVRALKKIARIALYLEQQL